MARPHLFVSGFALALAGAPAHAQTCQPSWDTAAGNPGIADGYVGPMFVFNGGAGGGDRLFAGGSFSALGGAAQTRGIAAWNPATAQWSGVGGGCYSTSTNYFLAGLGAYDFGAGNELVAGGSFATAGGVAATTNLARWNGTRWTGVLGGQPDGAVWAIATFGGRLYVGGGFTHLGTTTAGGIASWQSDESWQPVGSGIGGGFSPNVFALRAYDDGSGLKLYAGGRFSSLGGVPGLIARWTGSAWQAVGGGVSAGNTFSDIEATAVFNDGSGNALYVGGWDLVPSGSPLCNVAKWDGGAWHAVGQYLGGRTTALAVFDDGSGAGPALYAGGTAQPSINYVAKLVAGQWVTLSGGVGQPGGPPFPSVFGLLTWNDRLYVGGTFQYVGTAQSAAHGFAAWHGCTSPPCPADFNHDGRVTIQDIFDFLTAWFGGSATADFNHVNGVTVQDIFDFLTAWFAGC